jgi:hypothetical protein
MMKFSVSRSILVLGVAGALVGQTASAMAADTSVDRGGRIPQTAEAPVPAKVKSQAVKGKHLTKHQRAAMTRLGARIKKDAAKAPTGQNKVGSGYLVDWGCSNWFVSGNLWKMYCDYLFSDGSLGRDKYIYGFGYYGTDWYWVF